MITRKCAVLGGAASLLAALVLFLGELRGALIKLDLEGLTGRSRYVVCGQVTELRSYWAEIPKLGRVIVTDVTIAVAESWKGAPGKELTLQLYGGQVGDEWLVCVESPRYRKGEKVLVFVRDWKAGGGLWTTGWLQGKFELDERETGTVVKGRAGLPIAETRTLESVREEVRRIVLSSASGAGAGSSAPGGGTGGSSGEPR